jgi:hypothetical protein
MRAVQAKIGAVVVDSLPFSQAGTISQARGLAANNVAAVAVYLGVVNAARVKYITDSGMGVFPVTLAGEYNDGPADEVGQLKALGFPPGIHVFLDMEGMAAFKTDPAVLISKVNAWADGIRAAGYKPALYVGNPQPLTASELYALRVELYWRGQGRTVDRNNALSEPWGCGWAITQMYPSRNLGLPPVWVDMNMVGQDYKGRVPTWATA